jgi:hypothetical protein
MAKARTPTRTLHNSGKRRVIGELPSRKNGGTVAWESQLERDLFVWLEFRGDVVSYRCQPRRFDIWIDGRKAVYTPDAEVVLDDGRIHYEEAKTAEAARHSTWLAREQAAAEALSLLGYGFNVLTEKELRPGHRAHNLRVLYSYADAPRIEQASAEIPRIVGGQRTARLDEVLRRADKIGIGRAAVYGLIFRQLLACDLVGYPITHGELLLSEATR